MKIFFYLIIIFLSISCSSSESMDEIMRLDSENSKLKSELTKLKKEKEGRKKYVEIISTIVSEVYQELRTIDTGYIQIYSGELAAIKRNDLESQRNEMLEKISQMRKLIEKNHQFVRELELSRNEIQRFERVVEHLQARLEEKRIEINRLVENIFELREKILDLKEEKINFQKENITFRTTIFAYIRQMSSLERKVEKLNVNYEEEKEKCNKKYIFLVTKNNVNCDECTESSIEIKGKNINVLSNHLSNSYIIRKKKNSRKCYVLEILNQESFWQDSKFLVIFYKK